MPRKVPIGGGSGSKKRLRPGSTKAKKKKPKDLDDYAVEGSDDSGGESCDDRAAKVKDFRYLAQLRHGHGWKASFRAVREEFSLDGTVSLTPPRTLATIEPNLEPWVDCDMPHTFVEFQREGTRVLSSVAVDVNDGEMKTSALEDEVRRVERVGNELVRVAWCIKREWEDLDAKVSEAEENALWVAGVHPSILYYRFAKEETNDVKRDVMNTLLDVFELGVGLHQTVACPVKRGYRFDRATQQLIEFNFDTDTEITRNCIVGFVKPPVGCEHMRIRPGQTTPLMEPLEGEALVEEVRRICKLTPKQAAVFHQPPCRHPHGMIGPKILLRFSRPDLFAPASNVVG